MTDWLTQKKWSDQFLPEIKRELGAHLIGEPPVEEDIYHNTDLTVLAMNPVRIACRVREHKYLFMYNYINEFTMRSRTVNGTKTELSKVLDGWGDYMFYGFADEYDMWLEKWSLIDLDVFREWVLHSSEIPGQEFRNPDENWFYAFTISDAPSNMVVAQRTPVMEFV